MREFVAVAHPIFAFNERALKQQALMFRRIAIPTLSSILSATTEETRDVRRSLEWLCESDIVFEPTVEPYGRVYSDLEHDALHNLMVEDGKRLFELLFG